MGQARKAPGNISASNRLIDGIHHTLSVWRDREAMRSYLRSGAHLVAMKAFPKIATGKTIGYYAHTVPDWPQIHEIWREQGKTVQVTSAIPKR